MNIMICIDDGLRFVVVLLRVTVLWEASLQGEAAKRAVKREVCWLSEHVVQDSAALLHCHWISLRGKM